MSDWKLDTVGSQWYCDVINEQPNVTKMPYSVFGKSLKMSQIKLEPLFPVCVKNISSGHFLSTSTSTFLIRRLKAECGINTNFLDNWYCVRVIVKLLGVNFTNILWAVFTCEDPKSAKNPFKLSIFFALIGSARVKCMCEKIQY